MMVDTCATRAGLTAEQYIERLTPVTCHGDAVALATIKSYARDIAELDAKLASVESGHFMHHHWTMERISTLCQMQVAGFTALCYREG